MTEYVEHETHSPDPEQNSGRRLTLLAFIGILAVAALGYLIFSTQGATLVGGERPLKPLRSSPTPLAVVVDNQPVIVTFTQLNEDPAALLNRTIRVTGSYTPLELPNCQDNYSGPRIAWSLIAEELQLDAVGFEEVLKIVPPGTSLTIEGTWRLYQGPRGCGKEPPAATVWYLDVARIIQPNPLPNFGATAVPASENGDAEPVEIDATPIAPETIIEPAEPTATFLPATDNSGQSTQEVPTQTPESTNVPIEEATAAATTAVNATSTLTPTPIASPTTTPTPDPSASPTPTPTSSPTSGATATPDEGDGNLPTATPAAPLPTATPGNGNGYPYPPPDNT